MFKEHEFCYWLKGYFELNDSNKLSPQQVQIIKDHLNLVFIKVTPDRNSEIFDYVPDDTSYMKLRASHTGINAKGLC